MSGPLRANLGSRSSHTSADPAEMIRSAARPGARIVAIQPTQRDSQRATVRVSDAKAVPGGKLPRGRVVVTLQLKHLDELGLKVGMAWTPALTEAVVAVAAYDRALRQALDRLTRRRMSRRELDRKLQPLGHTEPVREKVLARLTELGLLDDRAYAEALVRDLQRRPAGPRLLRRKLYEKGIASELIDAVLAESAGCSQEQQTAALTLARKKLPGLQRVDAITRRRRLSGLLTRRGFSLEVIRHVLEDLEANLEEDLPGGWE